MKAVVIAGGFGTRMRPLSCTRPKHLFPIADRPLLDWTLEGLAGGGIEEVVFALNYRAESFVKRYGDFAHGVKVSYCYETRPLGTGGCVKNSEKTIGHENPFILLNGDILSSVDYAELVAQHRKNDAITTMTLHRVEDPSRYGIAELAEDNRIKRFVEKPKAGEARGNLANAGIYVLNPEIFDYIPGDSQVSIEREVFPMLVKDGLLYGYPFDGLWIDIGKPDDYLRANRLVLDSKLRKGRIARTATLENNVEVNSPIVVGEHTTIGQGSKVGPYAVVGDHVTVSRGVRIENSVIFSQSVLSDLSSLEGTVVGEHVILGEGVKIGEGCIIGDHAVIREGVTLKRGVTVCPSREVAESVLSPKCLM